MELSPVSTLWTCSGSSCVGWGVWRARTALMALAFMFTGSSTDISEDWEKDFDLDMTEEEVQLVLSKVEASGEVSAGEALAQPSEKAAWGRRRHFISSLG